MHSIKVSVNLGPPVFLTLISAIVLTPNLQYQVTLPLIKDPDPKDSYVVLPNFGVTPCTLSNNQKTLQCMASIAQAGKSYTMSIVLLDNNLHPFSTRYTISVTVLTQK